MRHCSSSTPRQCTQKSIKQTHTLKAHSRLRVIATWQQPGKYLRTSDTGAAARLTQASNSERDSVRTFNALLAVRHSSFTSYTIDNRMMARTWMAEAQKPQNVQLLIKQKP